MDDLLQQVIKERIGVIGQRPPNPDPPPDPNDPASYGGWPTWITNNPTGTFEQFRQLIMLPSDDPNAIHGGTGMPYEKKIAPYRLPVDKRYARPQQIQQPVTNPYTGAPAAWFPESQYPDTRVPDRYATAPAQPVSRQPVLQQPTGNQLAPRQAPPTILPASARTPAPVQTNFPVENNQPWGLVGRKIL